jgi:TRAP-type mannitol/chloroaromatic compound transport system permease large subunit
LKLQLRKELYFGFTIMGLILLGVVIMTPWTNVTNGHLGLIMLAMVVVAIMLGFPTAFTLMGMGMFFGWLAYRSVNPEIATRQILDLMVQRAYAVMANDVLIAIPLFVFMGYLVERAALIDRLFKSLHLALSRVPGSLAVATIITCAVFATATGIVGAVVTLMGLLAFPAMLRAGYNIQVSAGAVTAGGCLGILIPPSVLLIVYGATAGVSVVQLYAGAFFPGVMLASMYVGYMIILAKLKPNLMPPLPDSERRVDLPPLSAQLAERGRNAVAGLAKALRGVPGIPASHVRVTGQLLVGLLPAIAIAAILATTWRVTTTPAEVVDTSSLVQAGGLVAADDKEESAAGGLGEPPKESSTGLAEPPSGLQEPPKEPSGVQEPPTAEPKAAATKPPPVAAKVPAKPAPVESERLPTPTWFWVFGGIGVLIALGVTALMSWQRLEIFKMLLASFFPLAVLILAVLGSIVFGLATPAEAAAVGAFGGSLLALSYRYIFHLRAAGAPGSATGRTVREMGTILKDSSFLTAKTSAMVCWLFVGSSIFSAAFALLGGQEIIEKWVLSLGLSPIQFLILAQFIIFILGWPLEWTEIIVIFMPIFIPLLAKFNIDPLFFGLLVALNLQTAFLSPPVAMAAFYLKGVAPPHVTLNQIFMGMLPFMGIQIVALAMLYIFPEIGLWLPKVLYG